MNLSSSSLNVGTAYLSSIAVLSSSSLYSFHISIDDIAIHNVDAFHVLASEKPTCLKLASKLYR